MNFTSAISLLGIYLKAITTDMYKGIHHCTIYSEDTLETALVAKNKEFVSKQ